MKACVLTATGGIDSLLVAEVPQSPAPGPGEGRVAIRAAALNHLDLFVAEGLVGVEYAFPKIVGADAAGVGEAIGPGVTRARPGDRGVIKPRGSFRECEFCPKGQHSLCL